MAAQLTATKGRLRVALGVQRARDQLLARARLARDEHVGVGRRNAPDEGEDLLHGRRAADDVVQAIAAADLLAQTGDLGAQGAFGEGLVDAEQKLIDLEGLGDVVVGAQLDRPDGGVDGAEPGHDDDEGRGSTSRISRSRSRPSRSGILTSETTRSMPPFFTRSTPARPPSAVSTTNPFVFEIFLHPLAHVGVVVDHQDRRRFGRWLATARGSCLGPMKPCRSRRLILPQPGPRLQAAVEEGLVQHQRLQPAVRETHEHAGAENGLHFAAAVVGMGNDLANLVALAGIERPHLGGFGHFSTEGAQLFGLLSALRTASDSLGVVGLAASAVALARRRYAETMAAAAGLAYDLLGRSRRPWR
jgi:hypothetical protein